jgi:lipopolysaccharide export system permease protein
MLSAINNLFRNFSRILDRYIVFKFLGAFFFLLAIVIIICVVVDFSEKSDEIFDKQIPMSELFGDYYMNFIPFWANLLSPVCIFLAVIFFTARLAQRTELIPILTSGVSFMRLLAPYIFTAALLAGISFYLKGYLVPRATEQQIEFEYKYFKKRKIHKDRHVHKKVASDTFVYINFYNKNKKEGFNFTLERKDGADFLTRIKAEKAIWVDSTTSWKLQKVWRRDFNGEQQNLKYFAELDTTFLLSPDDIFVKEMLEASMTNEELAEFIRLEEMRGSDILQNLYFEQQRRYADPIAVIILTLIGFAMSSRKTRGGIALQIGIGLMISFFYIILLFAGKALISDTFSPFYAVWLPNFIFFPLSLFLLWISPK